MSPRVFRLYVSAKGANTKAPGEAPKPYVNSTDVQNENGDHIDAGGHILLAIGKPVQGLNDDLTDGKRIKVTIEDDDTPQE